LPMNWHNTNQTGDIIQRCTSDVDTVRMFLSEQLTNLMRVVILIVLAVAFMLRIHVGLTFVAMALVPVIVGYSVYFHKKIGETFSKVDAMEGRLSAMIQENLTGVRVVRAFGSEAYEKKRFTEYNEKYINTWIDLLKLLSSFWASGDLAGGLQVLLIISVGAVFCVNGTLTAGEFIEFISYNGMIMWPVRMLGRVISDMSKAGISIDRIMYIMNSPEESDREGAAEYPLDRDITFENVTFDYNNGKEDSVPELKNVSFTIEKGTTVGILGGTGSGKTTLIRLLDRLYELGKGEGRILIGGVDIKDIKLEHLRRNIGVVLQEPYLFSGTIAENIALTADSIRMNEVEKVAGIAALDETIDKFANGFDTYVGERGVTLSGGQKQRTAIAQMLIKNAPIMIFDDSLSAVDAETDLRIRKQLADIKTEATTIIIAHRISTLMNASKIIVLDKGRVAEMGSPEELYNKNGIYRRIYDLQQTV
nr:ABC transporter ATP-binding protein/permease [Lachnospiraceae bacterium]